MEVIVLEPSGFQVLAEPFTVGCGGEPVARENLLVMLQFSGSTAGVWSIEIRSGDLSLGTLPIEIRGPA